MEPGGPSDPQQPQYTHYRRPGQFGGTGGGFRTPRREIDLEAISEAWRIMTGNWAPALVAGAFLFIAIAFSQVASFVITPLFVKPLNPSTADMSDIFANTGMQILVGLPFGMIVSGVVYLVLGGVTAVALKQLRTGSSGLNDFWDGVSAHAGKTFVLGIVAGLAVTLGFYMCLLPGILLGGLFYAALPLVVDRGLNPFAALGESSRLTSRFLLMACVMLIVNGLLVILGAIACILPMFVMYAFTAYVQAVVYEDIRQDYPTEAY